LQIYVKPSNGVFIRVFEFRVFDINRFVKINFVADGVIRS
jgi:hypothetical protein